MIILLNSEKCDRCGNRPLVSSDDSARIMASLEDELIMLTIMFDGTQLCKGCFDLWTKTRRKVYDLHEHDLFRWFCNTKGDNPDSYLNADTKWIYGRHIDESHAMPGGIGI